MPSLVFVATEIGINNNKKIPKDKGVKLNKFKTMKASKVAMISPRTRRNPNRKVLFCVFVMERMAMMPALVADSKWKNCAIIIASVAQIAVLIVLCPILIWL